MYTVHTSDLPFKDKRLQSQVATWTSTLACTSNQFHSNWRSGPNEIPRMQMSLSLQWKGSGRGIPPLQAPNCRPSLLSKLILAPTICLYLTTAFFTAFMSKWWNTKTVISLVYIDTFVVRGPAEGIPCSTRLASLSLSLWTRGSKVETGDNPAGPTARLWKLPSASCSPASLPASWGTSC